MKKLIPLILSFLMLPALADEPRKPESGLGLGLGIPYGGFGLNLAHTLTDKVDLSLGFGTLFEPAWAAGVRFYPQPGDSGVRLSALYGTNAVLSTVECGGYYCESEYEQFQGFNVGIGWGQRGRSSGWDFDVLLVVTSGIDDRIDELEEQGYEPEYESSGVEFSFGYHWAF